MSRIKPGESVKPKTTDMDEQDKQDKKARDYETTKLRKPRKAHEPGKPKTSNMDGQDKKDKTASNYENSETTESTEETEINGQSGGPRIDSVPILLRKKPSQLMIFVVYFGCPDVSLALADRPMRLFAGPTGFGSWDFF